MVAEDTSNHLTSPWSSLVPRSIPGFSMLHAEKHALLNEDNPGLLAMEIHLLIEAIHNNIAGLSTANSDNYYGIPQQVYNF